LESLEPETAEGRVAVVLVGAATLLLTLALAKRSYPSSFFRGFLVAVGVIFSFDIVVFHWVFGLHRITAGTEANVIEPIVVAIGAVFVTLGLRSEAQSRHPPSRR
jgi:hypothetical protein